MKLLPHSAALVAAAVATFSWSASMSSRSTVVVSTTSSSMARPAIASNIHLYRVCGITCFTECVECLSHAKILRPPRQLYSDAQHELRARARVCVCVCVCVYIYIASTGSIYIYISSTRIYIVEHANYIYTSAEACGLWHHASGMNSRVYIVCADATGLCI